MKIKQVNNLSNNDYHNSEKYKDYWSSSNLKEYTKTPKEAYYQKFVASKKNTSAFQSGNQLHDFLSSRHVNGQSFTYNIFEPPVNPTTGKYYGADSQKYAYALEGIENAISANDMELINDIWRMIKSSDYAWYFQEKILGQGVAEPSFFIDGLHKYKIRPDVLTDKFYDYKTICKKDFYGNLNYIIKKRGYHISAAMYQYFEYQRTGIWKPFIIVWIMKEPPFDILIDDISQMCYELLPNGELNKNEGAVLFEALKNQHELCEMSGIWPGLAGKYPLINGIRIRESYSDYDRGFDDFEVD